MPSYPLTVPGAITNITLAIALPGTGPFDFATQIANKPTTLAGYGIVDALRAADAATTYATLAQFLVATGSDPNFAATVANSLALKAPLASPSLTGIPLSTTAAIDTNTFQIATTAFVIAQAYLKAATAASTYAPLASPSHTGGMTIAYGTAATALSPLTITQTWNGSGVVFPGAVLNFTDNVSAATSLFLDLQIAGSSKLSIQKSGKIIGNGSNPALFLDNALGAQLIYSGAILTNDGSSINWGSGGSQIWRFNNSGFTVGNSYAFNWSSTGLATGTVDLSLLRAGAGVLAQRNGANAQRFEVYNRYVSDLDYDKAVFDWTTTANVLTIGTQYAGSGARPINISASGSQIQLFVGGTGAGTFFSTQLRVPFRLCLSDTALSANDTFLVRDAAGVVAISNGVNAQGFRLYNTTNGTDKEFAVFDWVTSANTLTIGTQSAGAGTARSLNLVSATSFLQLLTSGSVISAQAFSNQFRIPGALGFDTSAMSVNDTFLQRDGAAGALALRNTTNAQSFRVYNTFIDASNYERAVFDWTTTANTLTIGSQYAGTGTARSLNLVSAASYLQLLVSSTTIAAQVFSNQLRIPQLLGFSDLTFTANDTFVMRDGTGGALAQRNGVNAQSFRVYNTWTDASNYERGVFDWITQANKLTIGAVAGGTGTQRVVSFFGQYFEFLIAGSTASIITSTAFSPWTDGGQTLGSGFVSGRWSQGFFKTALRVTGATSLIEAYNTAYDATNFEKGVFDWTTAANTLTIGTVAGGTGTLRSVNVVGQDITLSTSNNLLLKAAGSGAVSLWSAGSIRWFLGSTGHFYPNTTGVLDLGVSSNRIRDIYSSGALYLGAGTTAKPSLNIPAGTAPTSPNDGDFWQDGTNVKIRIGGVTKTFTII